MEQLLLQGGLMQKQAPHQPLRERASVFTLAIYNNTSVSESYALNHLIKCEVESLLQSAPFSTPLRRTCRIHYFERIGTTERCKS